MAVDTFSSSRGSAVRRSNPSEKVPFIKISLVMILTMLCLIRFKTETRSLRGLRLSRQDEDDRQHLMGAKKSILGDKLGYQVFNETHDHNEGDIIVKSKVMPPEKVDTQSDLSNKENQANIVAEEKEINEKRESPSSASEEDDETNSQQTASKNSTVSQDHSSNDETQSTANDNSESREEDIKKPELPPCRVLIHNQQDWHYEIFESTMMRYPVPWDELNCDSTSQPIIFDLAHAQTSWFANELDGWLEYHRNYLKGTIRTRLDGKQMQFGETFTVKEERERGVQYSAIIRASCANEISWLNSARNHFCVQHIECEPEKETCGPGTSTEYERAMKQSCWLNPMHKSCFFDPIDFPDFPRSKCSDKQPPRINFCTIGGAKRHDLMATVLTAIGPPEDLIVSIHQRDDKLPGPYQNGNLSSVVRPLHLERFLEFEESVSKCDVILPMVDPESNLVGYFPQGAKKTTGSIPQAMGYKIRTIMHEQLYEAYKDHLTAPSITYTDTQSLIQAAEKMIALLRVELPEERRKACEATEKKPDNVTLNHIPTNGTSILVAQ